MYIGECTHWINGYEVKRWIAIYVLHYDSNNVFNAGMDLVTYLQIPLKFYLCITCNLFSIFFFL